MPPVLFYFNSVITNGAFALRVTFWTDYIAVKAANYTASKPATAVDQVIILNGMDCVMMKMLEYRLIKKDGQIVQSLSTISLEFIVDLGQTGLTILTNFDVVKWL